MVFGALLQGYSTFAAAQSNRRTLEFQAEMAEINARMSERAAQQEQRRGQQEYAASRSRTAQVKGAQRAALAANGVALDEGSAVEVQASTDYYGEQDANTIQENTRRNVWGYRTQGVDYQNQAALNRSARPDPWAAATGSLLTSAGQVAPRWYRRQRVT